MPVMESITLENFRCFREKQTVKLAPLTLLVGENSTGKTSFLALIRALLAVALEQRPISFNAPPYDLGSFREIVHNRGGQRVADSFLAGFTFEVVDLTAWLQSDIRKMVPVELELAFGRPARGVAPALVRQRIAGGESWVEEETNEGQSELLTRVGTERGSWEFRPSDETPVIGEFGDLARYLAVRGSVARFWEAEEGVPELFPLEGSPEFSEMDLEALLPIERFGALLLRQFRRGDALAEPYSTGPMRTQPHRIYSSEQWERSADGNHIPLRLAELSEFENQDWLDLKAHMEEFGRSTGLFDGIEIDRFGRDGDNPFQLRVSGGGDSGLALKRNFVDVGYGVSQVLPIVTELLLPSSPTDMYLMQQPEVHLHPSAQAELGSLFCEVAAKGRQLIVETHSDHLINRVRMDVRDGTTPLTAEDALILYFERQDQDVRIHEITIDEQGNICGAPDSYREFFRLESRRSLGL